MNRSQDGPNQAKTKPGQGAGNNAAKKSPDRAGKTEKPGGEGGTVLGQVNDDARNKK